MKAVVQSKSGGVDTLRVDDIEKPIPHDGQLLVRVCAAGINRADIVQREGRYPAPPGASPILGLEVAGVIEEVCGHSRFRVGDAVLGLVPGGAYAEYVVLDSALAIAKPEAMSWIVAASLPEAWMTAWFNLVEIGAVREGENVLIHAGASGVGVAAIQLARVLGARAFASAGSSDKLDFCRELGALQVYDRNEQPEFSTLMRQWGGVDLILDPIAGKYLGENLASLNVDGRLIFIGIMGGAVASVNLGLVLAKRLSLRGSTLRNQPLEVKTRLASALEHNVLPALHDGIVSAPVDSVFPLERVDEAHAYIEANRNFGKVVLSVDV
ncbi:NAD(P)H-quinone oxidoreductase [Paludibacterium yongneupense]|uniref:NAD(P)H-quinone oxidoreductase n=1 Tax=Paludibacterium yongneupense TaxID=400061 RepID=UPI0003F7268F|nr:NAD(P)H-quinone oxidoreductase [Paludibacterium yongneupense]